jgi:aldose 1-epimerase
MPARVTRQPFGTLPDGRLVEAFTLTNAHGIVVRAMSFGARILSIVVPNRDGGPADIALGYQSLDAYLNDAHYFGAVVGRYANRIGHARFSLSGGVIQLSANDGPHHLHGGVRGFDRVLWEAEPMEEVPHGTGLTLTYESPDGEEGYPGRLRVRVSYLLTDRDELAVLYQAMTNRTTPVNLTQHTTFNLKGESEGDVLDHQLQISADRMIPVGDGLIPTGEIRPVDGGPFDFRTPVSIRERTQEAGEQLAMAGGYDHSFVLNRDSAGLFPAAQVYDPGSGRTLTVQTTEPGLHLYTGNFLSERVRGKSGRRYVRHGGFCLEAQHFPDSPNQPTFPSVLLRPDSEYRSRTVFRFGVANQRPEPRSEQ